MIDPADQQTQALTLDEQPAKKRRGRPATGKAMSPAEKQRAYRERLKAQQGGKPGAIYTREEAREAVRIYQEEIVRLTDELNAALNRAEKAEKSFKSNVAKKADAVFILQTKKGNRWVDSEICYYSTMQKAENVLKSLGEAGRNKEMWRIRQRQFL